MVTAIKRINLALQGGGAHGAFTWGVLDRLLEDDGIEIAGISGTSAGALNGAALKVGLVRGGRAAARENLDWLWGEVAAISDLRFPRWVFAGLPEGFRRYWSGVAAFPVLDAMTRVFSPYDYPMLSDNPLKVIADRFQYSHVCSNEGPALFVAATNVRSGKIRVFSGNEISSEVLLASVCLPTVFRAVEFRDPATGKIEAFWDGGYTGNPALFPLYVRTMPDDIVIVNINPILRPDLPRTAQEIQSRINEISFNASLLSELRAINFVRKLIAEGRMSRDTMKNVLVHMIADDDFMNELSVATKTIAVPSLLAELKEHGRRAADLFLSRHRADLNQETTVDLARLYG